MQEDKKIKRYLVLQSFFPLFVLIFIKHVGHFDSVFRFFASRFRGDWSVIGRAWESKYLGDVFITALCIAWFLVTFIVALGFKNYQSCNFDHYGEKIEIQSERKDSGVSFLVTILLPLLLDDTSSWRSLSRSREGIKNIHYRLRRNFTHSRISSAILRDRGRFNPMFSATASNSGIPGFSPLPFIVVACSPPIELEYVRS